MASGFWVGGQHPTSGLGGYPARDYGAPGGSPVYSWSTLRLIRISGASGYRGDGFGGYNLYLRDSRGNTYFMTHVENLRFKTGALIRPGQQIAQVGNYGTPHVHIGYTGGDPLTTVGLKVQNIFTPGGSAAGAKGVDAASPKGGSGVGSSGASGRTPVGIRVPNFPSLPIPGLPDRPKDPNDLIPSIPGAPSLGGIGAAIDAVVHALTWPFREWDRIIEVLGGFILVVVGLILMGRAMGVGGMRKGYGGGFAGRAVDPVEAAYARGEEDFLRSEARRAGRRAAESRARPSSQASEIPY